MFIVLALGILWLNNFGEPMAIYDTSLYVYYLCTVYLFI